MRMDHTNPEEGGHAPAQPSTSPAGPRPKGRFRWIKRLGVAAVLLVVAAVALGPTLGAKWLRGEMERQAGERVNGKVTIEDLKIGLNGKATLLGLVVEDAAGQLVARIPSARVDVGLRAIMTGKRDISAVVEDAEIELVRAADGTWNFADLVIPSEDDGTDEEEDPSEEDGTLLDLDIHGRVELVNATVSVRSPETMLTLKDIAVGLGLDGKERGLTIESQMSVHGGTGSAGDFAMQAIVWPKAGPGASLSELKISNFDMGVAQETLKLVGSPLEEGSVLAGSLNVTGQAQMADLQPDAAFELSLDGAIDNMIVDVRKDGLQTMAFDDEHASMNLAASRGAVGAEPKAEVKLRGRGDKLSADVHYDGAAAEGLTADIVVDALAASAGLEPLLARVHPVFASAQTISGAAVDASVTSNVHVSYGAPLPVATLAKGWAELPKEPLTGTGSLALSEGLVKASPFFAQVLQAFGEPSNPSFNLKPLGFAVEQGRVNYTNPWTWTIQGTETNFAGSVGLGGDLDMRWVVPVTGGLAEQNRVLRAAAGETLEVALGGTLTSPKFNVASALTNLATRVAKRELDSKLAEEKDRLKDKLNEKVGTAIGGDAGKVIDDVLKGNVPVKSVEDAVKNVLVGGQGADALLKSADKLWDSGSRAEAGVLYKRIRKEFPFSATYLINKKRIKKRQNGK